MKKYFKLVVIVFNLLLLSTGGQAQLLKGNVKSNVLQKDAIIVYNGHKNGGITSNQKGKLVFDGNGNFIFDDKNMEVDYTEATIYLGDKKSYGVFLQKGKTSIFNTVENNKGDTTIIYAGDNVELSKFSNLFVHYFDLMDYLIIGEKTIQIQPEAMNKLSSRYNEIGKALLKIKDENIRNYYTKYSSLKNLFIQLRLRTFTLQNARQDDSLDTQYQTLVNKINVNDPMGLKCSLPRFFIFNKIPRKLRGSYRHNMTDFSLAYISAIQKYVTNDEVKNALAEDVADDYFTYGKNNNVDKFWPIYENFVGRDSKLAKKCLAKVEAFKNTIQGKKAPDTTLSDTEGNQHKLSDYFGKLTYIDVWATWCVPCCREIPFLEKLVEHYKGNDNIQFISISVDSDHAAWLAKLQKDKPAWKQFNLNKEENQAFSKAWNISGIPRFIIIDKNGNIYDADAIRPSDKNIITTLDKLIQ
jgi:thiol-disulfide isomerase/thioredoxin